MAAPTLQFLGGAGTVTGSKFLLEHDGTRILVDCGLFQGRKDLRLRNWERLAVDPASIDAVVLTHAHVDHCGYLPRLRRDGFDGPVFATAGTAALVRIVLPDAGHLQEEEAGYANRKGFSRHNPALPLFTEADARETLELLRTVPFDEECQIAPGISATFRFAGHILGSSIVTVRLGADGPNVTFSGDLGRPSHPLLAGPADVPESDWIVIESTYGDRAHDDEQGTERLGEVIARTVRRGGTVLIPAFAVDRTEVILLSLAELARQGVLSDVPIYVNSPMALDALRVYRDAVEEHSPEIRAELSGRRDLFDLEGLVEVRDVRGSQALNDLAYPAIIVSASGMATGGRVVHHLAHQLPDHRNSVILVGYQAEGTRGRLLLDGARHLKMLGRYIPVRAEIVNLNAFSVHADRDELLDWLRSAPRPPQAVFIVHGEPVGADALQQTIADELDWTAVVPRPGERVRLDVPPPSRDVPPPSRDVPPPSRDVPPPSRDVPKSDPNRPKERLRMSDTDYPKQYDELVRGFREMHNAIPEQMEGFTKLHRGALGDGALSTKHKELMALAIGIAVRCDGCVAFHVKDALRAGATRAEIEETVGVAILMGGGPAAVYGAHAFVALAQFEEAAAPGR